MSIYASLTVPQFRLLGRALRGEHLLLERFRLENPTLRALVRKGCLAILSIEMGQTLKGDGSLVGPVRTAHCWMPTLAGRDKYARGGKPGRASSAVTPRVSV